MWDALAALTLRQLYRDHPYVSDFFPLESAALLASGQTVEEYFAALSEEDLQNRGIGRSELRRQFVAFMQQMECLKEQPVAIQSITIQGGIDKSGRLEEIDLTIHCGEIISIVGPTGSGKSRLLADIEWVAQADTPTRRRILVNGQIPDSKHRFDMEYKLVAQLSQNMNFVMDLSAAEFVGMHAESRMLDNAEELTRNIVSTANELAGEGFTADTPVTSLSGGQSRALMIADTAYLSSSPIVLIDEIENAGIDRKKALQLLVDKQKIVLMATHDPILALMGDKRLVIKNGGISQVLDTSAAERQNLIQLEEMDRYMTEIRNTLRSGGRIDILAALLPGSVDAY